VINGLSAHREIRNNRNSLPDAELKRLSTGPRGSSSNEAQVVHRDENAESERQNHAGDSLTALHFLSRMAASIFLIATTGGSCPTA
jgi:hypothetical protein